jgi:hypothetical protein
MHSTLSQVQVLSKMFRPLWALTWGFRCISKLLRRHKLQAAHAIRPGTASRAVVPGVQPVWQVLDVNVSPATEANARMVASVSY